jgi:hypothetical protein
MTYWIAPHAMLLTRESRRKKLMQPSQRRWKRYASGVRASANDGHEQFAPLLRDFRDAAQQT